LVILNPLAYFHYFNLDRTIFSPASQNNHGVCFGCTIKLVGLVDEKRLLVEPMLVPFNGKICVDNTLNAVEFKTDLAKEIIIGHGAGPIETASKMLNDMIEIFKNQTDH